MIPCVLCQRRGFVTIPRDIWVNHALKPTGDAPGNFRDQSGRPVYRQSGRGSAGQIHRFKDASVDVYWDSAIEGG